MSKIGKQPITIPNSVQVSIDGRTVSIKGPKGESVHTHPREVSVRAEDNQLIVEKASGSRQAQAMWGLWRALLANEVTGMHEGFEKKLELSGVGYRAAMKGKDIEFQLGLSHAVLFEASEGITLGVEDKVITVAGPNKQRVGQVAAEIRDLRLPEPYKGKGIKYVDEVIRRKAGKAAKAAA